MAKLFVLFLVLLITFVAGADPTYNSSDKAVLPKLKQAVGNPDLLSSWTPDTDCCQWQLAFCSPTGRIANLVNANHNLSAQITAIVTDLPYLEILQFDNLPKLRGLIPVAITKLRHFRIFTVIGSQLSGGIPSLLAEIKTLKLLDLHSIRFCTEPC